MIYVYKAISPSFKVYIGITSNFTKRKSSHVNEANCKNVSAYSYKFKRAIRKYKNNLKWEIIDAAVSYDGAHLLEKSYIKLYDSYKNGYNMTLGGDGNSRSFSPYKWTKSKILKIAKTYSNKPEWNKENRNSYLAAKRFDKENLGFFEKYIEHMDLTRKRPTPANFKWDKNKVLKEALKYKTLKEFKFINSPAYTSMHKYKKENYSFYIKCTAHMEILRRQNGRS